MLQWLRGMLFDCMRWLMWDMLHITKKRCTIYCAAFPGLNCICNFTQTLHKSQIFYSLGMNSMGDSEEASLTDVHKLSV